MPYVGILHVLFHKYKTGLLFLILSAKNQRCAGIKKKNVVLQENRGVSLGATRRQCIKMKTTGVLELD